MSFVLRDYQQKLVHQVRVAIRDKFKRILVVAATGAGKTLVFSYIAKSAAEKKNRVLILAHRDALIKQASRKLNDYGVQHGIIMAGFTPDPMAKTQVASVQTLVRRLAKIRFKPTIIIVDEAHLSAAASYVKIFEAFPDAIVLGFTGSPCRLDNKPLGRQVGGIYDELVQAISIADLIKQGYLVKPRYFTSQEKIDLSGISKSGGDHYQKELAERVDKPKLIGDAVQQYRKICNDVPAVAWCVNIAHAQHVADEFNRHGIKSVMLCGDSSGEERDAAMKALEDGTVKVVTFVGILVEGVDCPAIGAIILLRPTMSLSSYLQVIGRGLRPFTAPDGTVKDCCYVLDHAGLYFSHGPADMERDWSLDEGEVKKPGKKKANEPRVPMLVCDGPKGCFAVFEPADAEAAALRLGQVGRLCCPNCQKLLETKQKAPEHEDGELAEVTEEVAAQIKWQKKREEANAETFEDLQRIGAQRGYSPGWAKHRWEARLRKKAQSGR